MIGWIVAIKMQPVETNGKILQYEKKNLQISSICRNRKQPYHSAMFYRGKCKN